MVPKLKLWFIKAEPEQSDSKAPGEPSVVESSVVESSAAEPSAAEPPAVEELTDEQLEAEAALARLEDRIGAFTAYTIAADFLELRQIYAGTFERTKEEDWAKKTDRRAEGWTRRQALAHVDSVTHTYNAAIMAGLEGRPVDIPGFAQRTDLKEVNRAAIEARADMPVADLVASFLGALEEAARLAAVMGHEQLGHLVATPFFGATPTVAELFGSSLAHAGIVHGAQLAIARARPIWIYYQPGMMRRQLTRFVHMCALVYWPERGGDLHATIGFSVEGQGGGSWMVRVGPEGGQGKIGIARTTDVRLTFASADLFCRTVTFQTQIWRQLLLRRIRV
ncbi:MAG: hypothetical protein HGA45_33010, partial [Chloroflexales bacterium]|nr:hypothetical protein [Chloroflexales bacterium]